MDFNIFCISGNRNECLLKAGYLLIYFTPDLIMTPLLLKREQEGESEKCEMSLCNFHKVA